MLSIKVISRWSQSRSQRCQFSTSAAVASGNMVRLLCPNSNEAKIIHSFFGNGLLFFGVKAGPQGRPEHRKPLAFEFVSADADPFANKQNNALCDIPVP